MEGKLWSLAVKLLTWNSPLPWVSVISPSAKRRISMQSSVSVPSSPAVPGAVSVTSTAPP